MKIELLAKPHRYTTCLDNVSVSNVFTLSQSRLVSTKS